MATLTVLRPQSFAEKNDFWKFNSPLIYNKIYVSKMKEII